MDDAKSRVAVFHRAYDDPHCKEVVDLIHRLVLVDHLFINTEEMLHTPAYLRFDVRVLHMLLYLFHDLLYELLPLHLTVVNLLHKLEECLRLGILKSQVVKLCLDLGYPKPLGDGGIDIHRLLRLLLLLRGRHELERPHIVQAVRQLNNDDPDIFRHSKEHLTQVLCLHF